MREKRTTAECMREFILYGVPLITTVALVTTSHSPARRKNGFNSEILRDKKREQEWRCGDCGEQSNELEGHHRVPINLGGSKHPDNLVMLCTQCHEKWDKKAVEEKIIFEKDNDQGISIYSAPRHLFQKG